MFFLGKTMDTEHIFPYKHGLLEADALHKIYYACYGNPLGKPILIIHGGPGYYFETEMLAPFDLTRWNVIAFDQRGCGQSVPKACIQHNSTEHLIQDIKAVLDFLKFPIVAIKAESWGTTLAILFAERYPDRVSAMLLTNCFIGNNHYTNLGINSQFGYVFHAPNSIWFDQENSGYKNDYRFYAEQIHFATKEAQLFFSRELIFNEIILTVPNRDMEVARAICSSIDVCSIAKIETFYTVNNFFVDMEQLLGNLHLIKNKPVTIIHAKDDPVVPFDNAEMLLRFCATIRLIVANSDYHNDLSGEVYSLLKKELRRLYYSIE